MPTADLDALPAAAGCSSCHHLWRELAETRAALIAAHQRIEELTDALASAALELRGQKPIAQALQDWFQQARQCKASTALKSSP